MNKRRTLSVAVLVMSLGILSEISAAGPGSNDHGNRDCTVEQGVELQRKTQSSASAPRTASSRVDGIENMLSELSKEVAGKVLSEMKEEGQQVMTSRVAVVSAVPLSDLKRETEFGRMVAEYFMTDLADRGILVEELRLGTEINIVPQAGEFILSQNVGELAQESPALDYVVVSTFTNTRKTLILQGRMISLPTGLVTTSWRYTLPLNRELVTLLDGNRNGSQEPFTIAVKGMGEGIK